MAIRTHWAALMIVLASATLAMAQEAPAPSGKPAQPEGAVLDIGPVAVKYAGIRIAGQIVETLPSVYLMEPSGLTLYELIERIDTVRRDDSVRGLVVRLDDVRAGWAKAQEIRQALERVREAGKEVICYMDSGGNAECYIASAAERIALHPAGVLGLVGFRAEVVFWKGLLDKIGVKADFIQVGKYKGATEPLMRTAASEAFRESFESILDDYMRQLVDGVAAGRKLEPDAVRALIDQGPFSAERALKTGLIDQVASFEEMIAGLRERQKRPVELVKDYGMRRKQVAFGPQDLLKRFFGMGAASGGMAAQGPKIAVIYAVGPIVKGDPDEVLIGESVVNSGQLGAIIRQVRDDANFKAIVLRVDSPGGSPLASDIIWTELREADKVKPVIVSMSDTAGSGGYYIAAAGRKIFAEEGTLTGSIGVMGGKLVLKGLFEKIGLTVDVFERGKNAGLYSAVQEFTPAQRAIYREIMVSTYNLFLKRIATSRNVPVAEIEKMAGGRVWTGHQALEGKLVDEIGGLRDAIIAAGEAAGLAPGARPKIVRLPRSRNIVEFFLSGVELQGRAPTMFDSRLALHAPALGSPYAPPQLREVYLYLRALYCMRSEHALALMPGLVWIE